MEIMELRCLRCVRSTGCDANSQIKIKSVWIELQFSHNPSVTVYTVNVVVNIKIRGDLMKTIDQVSQYRFYHTGTDWVALAKFSHWSIFASCF